MAETLSELSPEIAAMMRGDDAEYYAIDGVGPLGIVTPRDEDDLREIVGSANREGIAVYPRGGGTRLRLGGIPQRPGIVVDTTRLNRVVAHNAGDLTATFQSGATFQLVAEVLAQEGQLLAIDPPTPTRATIGGTLATGVSGPAKWHFGHPRDTLIGMRVVQPDGSVSKSGGQVVKNVSGYDMSRLHIGGLGSLGVILESSFKLTPMPMYESTVSAQFGSGAAAMDAAMRLFNSHVMPLAMTAFSLAAADRLPIDFHPGAFFLSVRLGGRPRSLDRQIDETVGVCRESGAVRVNTIEGAEAGRVWRCLSDFGWSDDLAADLNVRIAVMPDQVATVAEAVESARSPSMQVAVVAQPGFGTLEANWFRSDSSCTAIDDFSETVAAIRGIVGALGGTTTVQICPTALKHRIDVWDGEPAGFSVMREMKMQYDPNNVMNPGRFVGGI